MGNTRRVGILALAILAAGGCSGSEREAAPGFRIATFEADVTPPVGHPLCGGMVAPAARIADPLSARGFILWGGEQPIVVCALDWTELRNEAYDRWRAELAKAAGTSPRNVLLSCVHQHDAPYADLEAQRLLDAHGLKGLHVDPVFHERALGAVAAAVRGARPRRVTHLGTGQAVVERVASNRRVVVDGRVSFKRYSRTADRTIRDAPEGLIDPALKTLSFWDGERPILALSAYAVHPMSHYGGGAVSADFPGLARARRQEELPNVFQIYGTGCAGDVTAAKYNDGNDASRKELAERLRQGMARAWEGQRRTPLEKAVLRASHVRFEPSLSIPEMERALADAKASKQSRLMAALGLSWTRRASPVDVPAIDFGGAQIVLLPAESFVEFQLAAQRLRPDQFILVLGYGECGPGYIPTEAARAEGYVEEHGYSWVAAGAEGRLMKALAEALGHRP